MLGLAEDDGEYYIDWKEEAFIPCEDLDSYSRCLSRTSGDGFSGDSHVQSLQNAVALSCATSIISDDATSSLILTMKDGSQRLWHSSIVPPSIVCEKIASAVSYATVESSSDGVVHIRFGLHQGSADRGGWNEGGDWREGLLERFSRVVTFYTDTAQHIFGLLPGQFSDSSSSAGYIPNPWIERRAVDLPSARYTGQVVGQNAWERFTSPDGKLSNPDNLQLLVHCGSLDSKVRFRAWLWLLGVRPGSMTDEQYDSHCQGLQVEYQELQSRQDALPQDTQIRIGAAFEIFSSL